MAVNFVAEVASNHNQDLERCFSFIDKAAEIGCQAVKFQLFKIDQLFTPEILAQSEVHRRRGQWELPVDFLPHLAAQCHRAGLKFGCTPFYLAAVAELWPHVDFYKVASYEILWPDLLISCAKTNKPIVLSTGMATLEEVRGAVNTLRRAGCQALTLLHGVSNYPARPEDCNLAAMETLRRRFDCPVGWSDHSLSPGVIYRASHRFEADMIEFHLDLDGQGAEFNLGHCWLPEQIKTVMDTVRLGLEADGHGRKEPSVGEAQEREWRADPTDGLRPLKEARRVWRA